MMTACHTARSIEVLAMGRKSRLFVWVMTGAVIICCGCRESSHTPVESGGAEGSALFQQHCATCHPDGGNTLYPQKSLQKGVLAANGITTPEGIISRMRNPGPRMKRFDSSELNDADARKIAAYILETFN
jgi:cytochrome c6